MSLEVVNFGCRLNAYEGEAIKARAGEAQLRDAVVVNTCAVTAEAVRQSRQAIRRLKRENPARRIIVTGCAAQIAPDDYAAMPEVERVLGNREKLDAGAYANFGLDAPKIRVNDIMAVREHAPQMLAADGSDFGGQPRAFLEVQNGCDHRCTFCVIPYGRGNSRSVPMGAVVREAQRLAGAGYGEVVLTGVDLTSYGADLPGGPSLGELVGKILKLVPELKRLRLSSLDSIEADDALMRVIAEEERLMPHFHLSAQSGDDLILKRMKRRHSRADTLRFCQDVRRLRPEAAFGADFITGFPTESEAMFQNTLALVDEAGLSVLHVFPFSPRPFTPAARMPQQKGGVARERAQRLRDKGAAALSARLGKLAGRTMDVLVEQKGLGRTECFTQVEFSSPVPTGAIIPMAITGAKAGRLLGEPA